MKIDFKKFAHSNNIEDQIKAIDDPDCPSEIIVEILDNQNINWETDLAISLATKIVSHPKISLSVLLSIFSCYNSSLLSKLTEEEAMSNRNLIIQNPNWDLEQVILTLSEKIKSTDDGDEKCFIVASIVDSEAIDDDSEKRVYSGLYKTVNSLYCLSEWALKVGDMGDDKLVEHLLNELIIIVDQQDRWDFIFDPEFEFQDHHYMNKLIMSKLKLVGFGRYSNPNSGDIIAKSVDGKLVSI